MCAHTVGAAKPPATLFVACLLLAALTIEFHSNSGFSSLGCLDPGAVHPRWLMPHVLLVAALQIRDPVFVVVSVKIDDLPFQCVTPRFYFRLSFRLVAYVPGTVV